MLWILLGILFLCNLFSGALKALGQAGRAKGGDEYQAHRLIAMGDMIHNKLRIVFIILCALIPLKLLGYLPEWL